MGEIHRFPGSTVLKHRQNVVPKAEPELDPTPEPAFYCVYNQSQERFVSTSVIPIDGAFDNADAQLRSLGPGSQGVIWISPYRSISATNLRFPLDLVLLSSDCIVLSIAASFPLSGSPPSDSQAASLLVFPADTLAQEEIVPGDQLIVSGPQEMKHYLKRLHEAEDSELADGGATSSLGILSIATHQPHSPPVAVVPVEPSGAPPQAEPPAGPKRSQTKEDQAVCRPSTMAAPKPEGPDRPWIKRQTARNWLHRLLLGESPDPRRGPRRAIPGLVAYFFTGGAPTAHEVRDISTSGIYILTGERWYAGTVLRLTLCDRHNPKTERSLTVNAKVVRWAKDGVGFEFLLDEDGRPSARNVGPDHPMNGISISQIEDFIARLGSA